MLEGAVKKCGVDAIFKRRRPLVTQSHCLRGHNNRSSVVSIHIEGGRQSRKVCLFFSSKHISDTSDIFFIVSSTTSKFACRGSPVNFSSRAFGSACTIEFIKNWIIG